MHVPKDPFNRISIFQHGLSEPSLTFRQSGPWNAIGLYAHSTCAGCAKRYYWRGPYNNFGPTRLEAGPARKNKIPGKSFGGPEIWKTPFAVVARSHLHLNTIHTGAATVHLLQYRVWVCNVYVSVINKAYASSQGTTFNEHCSHVRYVTTSKHIYTELGE